MLDPRLRWFEYRHLPPHLQDVSGDFARLAERLCEALSARMADGYSVDLIQLQEGLQRLLEAKDAFVRAFAGPAHREKSSAGHDAPSGPASGSSPAESMEAFNRSVAAARGDAPGPPLGGHDEGGQA